MLTSSSGWAEAISLASMMRGMLNSLSAVSMASWQFCWPLLVTFASGMVLSRILLISVQMFLPSRQSWVRSLTTMPMEASQAMRSFLAEPLLSVLLMW